LKEPELLEYTKNSPIFKALEKSSKSSEDISELSENFSSL